MKETSPKLRLQDCTKEELLFIIDRLKFHALSRGDYYVQCALEDVSFRRESDRIAKAKKVSALASDKQQEYIDLLRPYEGMHLNDIPIAVIHRAADLRKEVFELNKRWCKLMDIDLSGGKKTKSEEG